jgi:hypothetical protein
MRPRRPGTAQAVPGALDVLAAALWLVLAGAYLSQGPRIILADLRDPVLSPFVDRPPHSGPRRPRAALSRLATG